MKIPRYWIRTLVEERFSQGKALSTQLYGWSNESLAAARAQAQERGRKILRLLHENGGILSKKQEYEYGQNPLREKIKEEFQHNGQTSALITRNRYGALVLNTAKVMFVDIDLPDKKPPASSFSEKLQGLFQPSKYQAEREKKLRNWQMRLLEDCLRPVRRWASNQPRSSLRIYRTYAGLRVLLTDKLYEPNSPETAQIFQEFNADPLYTRLTKNQECFRARLTPKPWRIQGKRLRNPPSAYPWAEDENQLEAQYREWEVNYSKRSQDYATCTLLESHGQAAKEPEIEQIIQLHDQHSLAKGKPLA